LDDLNIPVLSEYDKAFLEEFKSLEYLSLNTTGLRSLNNMPDLIKLVRLDLKNNQLSGNEISNLTKFKNL
jgi:hypothetical protein